MCHLVERNGVRRPNHLSRRLARTAQSFPQASCTPPSRRRNAHSVIEARPTVEVRTAHHHQSVCDAKLSLDPEGRDDPAQETKLIWFTPNMEGDKMKSIDPSSFDRGPICLQQVGSQHQNGTAMRNTQVQLVTYRLRTQITREVRSFGTRNTPVSQESNLDAQDHVPRPSETTFQQDEAGHGTGGLHCGQSACVVLGHTIWEDTLTMSVVFSKRCWMLQGHKPPFGNPSFF